jgi:excisionase family DNA binding protein
MTDPITPTEAAAIIGVSANRVRTLIRAGRIPARRIGQIHLIERDAAVAFRSIPRPPGNRTGRARTRREDGR